MKRVYEIVFIFYSNLIFLVYSIKLIKPVYPLNERYLKYLDFNGYFSLSDGVKKMASVKGRQNLKGGIHRVTLMIKIFGFNVQIGTFRSGTK
jgi:hypothetical protein